MGNKFIFAFSKNIAVKNSNKITVQKKTGDGPYDDVDVTAVVETANKKLLIITLPAYPVTTEQYKVNLAAGAVHEEGKAANENALIAAESNVIAGPALRAENAFYVDGTTLRDLVIIFNGTGVQILDKDKIKVLKYVSSRYTELDSTAIPDENIIVGTPDDRLEITLPPTSTGDKFKIQLDKGALIRNTRDSGVNQAITPSDVITIGSTLLAASNPLSWDGEKLAVSFQSNVALLNGADISVEKAKGAVGFTAIPQADRTIESHTTDTKKLLITLKDGLKLEAKYKVTFPIGSVLNTANRVVKDTEQTTNEITAPAKYSDIYTWKKESTSNSKGGNNIWEGRQIFGAVVYKENIWVMGGYDRTNYFNDVWSSPDGAVWTRVKESSNASWSKRNQFGSAVFQNKIWVLGGWYGTKNLADVWSSTDGAAWTEVPQKGKNWSARRELSVVVHDGKLWVIGGISTSRFKDVYSSTDGETWKRVTADAGWDARSNYSAEYFDCKFFVIGGIVSPSKFDVWTSSNGSSWVADNNLLISSDRTLRNYSLAVYKNRLWMMGGFSVGGYSKTIRSLGTGTDARWTVENTPAWSARNSHKSLVFQDRLWVLGGHDGNDLNDVWSFGPSAGS